MLCNRIKQFREYNGLSKELLAKHLKIDTETYDAFEKGSLVPDIDIVHELCKYYKVTVNEFYGYTPRITLHSPEVEDTTDEVDERILKMSDLSWDESQLILYYRTLNDPETDDIISKIIRKNADKD